MKIMIVLDVEAASSPTGMADIVARLLAMPGLRRCASSVRVDVPGAFPPGLGAVLEAWTDPSMERGDVVHSLDALWSTAGILSAVSVEEFEPVVLPPAPIGKPTPGLRMLSLCQRRTGLTPQAFREYWLGPHAAVAQSFSVALMAYQQNVVLECLHGQPVDGIASMHFRSFEHFRERYQGHPEDAARGAADAARFLDDSRTGAFTSLTVHRDLSGPS